MAPVNIPAPIINPQIKYTQIFINNEWVNSHSGQVFATLNPATEEKIADIQESLKEDVDDAVAAARKAFQLGSPWRRMNASGRGRYLLKFADLIERDAVYLASLEMQDGGKPYTKVYGEMASSASLLRYYAGAADKVKGTTIPLDGDYFSYTRMEPIGVCAQIIPWNFPLFLFIQKLAPALAAGCTCVVKPAEQTPLSALYAGTLIQEIELPPGVVNIVPGYGPTAGAALTMHMDVDMVAFTGSTEVGRLIMEASGKSNLKKVTLELGGKSPNIFFADVDVNSATDLAVEAIMEHAGQVCVAGSRTFVHEDIYDEFVDLCVKKAKALIVGDPQDPKTFYGPQVDEIQMNKVLELIASGVEQGARLMCGGKRKGDKGYFIEPTVFVDVTPNMRIAREEIFGPVQSIFKFKTIEEVIEKANDTTYGLAAAVHTSNIETALTVAHSIRAGSMWVNTYDVVPSQTPFGGYKMSGMGREMGMEMLHEYCEIKTVTIRLPNRNS